MLAVRPILNCPDPPTADVKVNPPPQAYKPSGGPGQYSCSNVLVFMSDIAQGAAPNVCVPLKAPDPADPI